MRTIALSIICCYSEGSAGYIAVVLLQHIYAAFLKAEVCCLIVLRAWLKFTAQPCCIYSCSAMIAWSCNKPKHYA